MKTLGKHQEDLEPLQTVTIRVLHEAVRAIAHFRVDKDCTASKVINASILSALRDCIQPDDIEAASEEISWLNRRLSQTPRPTIKRKS